MVNELRSRLDLSWTPLHHLNMTLTFMQLLGELLRVKFGIYEAFMATQIGKGEVTNEEDLSPEKEEPGMPTMVEYSSTNPMGTVQKQS